MERRVYITPMRTRYGLLPLDTRYYRTVSYMCKHSPINNTTDGEYLKSGRVFKGFDLYDANDVVTIVNVSDPSNSNNISRRFAESGHINEIYDQSFDDIVEDPLFDNIENPPVDNVKMRDSKHLMHKPMPDNPEDFFETKTQWVEQYNSQTPMQQCEYSTLSRRSSSTAFVQYSTTPLSYFTTRKSRKTMGYRSAKSTGMTKNDATIEPSWTFKIADFIVTFSTDYERKSSTKILKQRMNLPSIHLFKLFVTHHKTQSKFDVLKVISENYFAKMNATWPWSAVDHRVDGWPLMDSIRQPSIMLLTYFGVVLMGPKMMKNRKPMDVKWAMIGYNTVMSLFNLYIVVQFVIAATRLNYNWFCEATRSTHIDKEEMRMVTAIYLYFVSKPIEWLDTLFFILRKKSRQLTPLHVYHHSSIFAISWALTRCVPSGSTFVPELLNSIVHVVMYGYYAISAFGPEVQKYLWWKKYITMFQLVQFVLQFSHGLRAIVMGCSEYSIIPQYLIVSYATSFLILFGSFYLQNYIKKSGQSKSVGTDSNHKGIKQS
ncbi:hypothetical protein CHUAL_012543 [Chamberlinius hualienensis]